MLYHKTANRIPVGQKLVTSAGDPRQLCWPLDPFSVAQSAVCLQSRPLRTTNGPAARLLFKASVLPCLALVVSIHLSFASLGEVKLKQDLCAVSQKAPHPTFVLLGMDTLSR